MSMHYISMDRSNRFEATITPDRRTPELQVLTVRGFDTIALTLTKEQLATVGRVISSEAAEQPF